jgi:hypothetical protein
VSDRVPEHVCNLGSPQMFGPNSRSSISQSPEQPLTLALEAKTSVTESPTDSTSTSPSVPTIPINRSLISSFLFKKIASTASWIRMHQCRHNQCDAGRGIIKQQYRRLSLYARYMAGNQSNTADAKRKSHFTCKNKTVYFKIMLARRRLSQCKIMVLAIPLTDDASLIRLVIRVSSNFPEILKSTKEQFGNNFVICIEQGNRKPMGHF